MTITPITPISNYNTDQSAPVPFHLFLEDLKGQFHKVFHQDQEQDPGHLTRGVPEVVMTEIMSRNPLSVSIPVAYGGRGGDIAEILSVLSAASYESLALSLTIGINSALFIQPVAKFAGHDLKGKIFNTFLKEQSMGGLMITEPDYGSNALHMHTSFTESADRYHIRGTKHWAGLTGYARYWLLTAREQSKSGELKRDVQFFICDVNQPGQQIVVEEKFDNLGLFQIPYGRNRIDVSVPRKNQLEPETTGINLLLDLLHRSRLQFPGMALGFIQRMMDEAIGHCRQRLVGGKSLFNYDQVQKRLAQMQASFTIASAMCAYSCGKAGLENDLSAGGMVANSFKSVVTDLMQAAAQSLVQLVGAKAYRYNHIGGRGIIDSRPFQIFEGSNDILYTQISEYVVRQMKKLKEHNLYRFLKTNGPTENSVQTIRHLLDFELNLQLPQRKLVELGQVIGRIVSMEMVINLGQEGFRQDLVQNALEILRSEISGLMGNFQSCESTLVVVDYQQDSSWLSLRH
ncbi:MAG: acyl-CoA dehydrogenase family protein [Bacteroidota bacterium]